ncbi:MAG: 1,2-phenylacetyl-CoA epoxidase subunit PaaC [Polaromonas sp.]|uniref:1,2-phenylacetyl-CoA epoxidase subunit PaaC n=1 Tax=Polaromonas sp. TaxID=1869339 RepID=UPI002732897C|nr:1,2-phenylacetyl-CoA epoxidase subunit PaaC [Polaromonas sp.]MDP2819057.1 1,2-phenylacetyl-CoA epoxidase subunit PaaC [Polaromonas sp.]
MAALATPVTAPLDYLLHLADNALVLGQRNAEWCGNGPVLEEDIALANMSLDLIGQARMLYQHAAKIYTPTLPTSCGSLPPEGALRLRPGKAGSAAPAGEEAAGELVTEDTLAYFRDAGDFRNFTLLELPHASSSSERDYAVTITRNFFYSALMLLLWEALQTSTDTQLAAIAGKSLKEVRYHFRHSRDWLVRLGDGTAESHARSQSAVNHLMPYTHEYWAQAAIETIATPETAAGMAMLQTRWDELVNDALEEAGLQRPRVMAKPPQGKNGQHSAHLAPLLADMQSLARAHPQARW